MSTVASVGAAILISSKTPCMAELSPATPSWLAVEEKSGVSSGSVTAALANSNSSCWTLQIYSRGGCILVIVPIDFCLLNAVENRIATQPGEIIPSPFYDRLNLRSDVRQQRYVDAKPCNESDHPVNLATTNAHLGYC